MIDLNPDPINAETLKLLLSRHGVRPRRHWGQNFLVSESMRKKMLAEADISPEDTVLEIGGGAGALSVTLATHAKRLVVVERDPSLCDILQEVLAPFQNTEILCVDAREFNPSTLGTQPYTLVSNLPYSVGLPILRHLLESPYPPKDCFVMLQREVADRLSAEPPNLSLAGATMQVLADVQRLFVIPKEATWPVPDVDSAWLQITPRAEVSPEEREELFSVMKKGFAHPRKRVLASFSRTPEGQNALSKSCAIPFNARPAELTREQWQRIANNMSPR